MNSSHIRKIEKHFGKVVKHKRVSKWRQVYKIDFNDSVLRLDILTKGDETLSHHEICLEAEIDCFPKIKKVFDVGNLCLKMSDWVIGHTYSEMVQSDSLTEDMLFKMGSSIAKINNISKNDLYLHNDDITYHNVMLDTNGNFVMFDLDRLLFIKDTDGALVKTLLKRIGNRKMIDAFLSGYKEHRDISNLVYLCDQRKWQWKWKK